MTCKRTQNLFKNLYVDDSEIEDKEKEIKKAMKKLNEIDKLKKKSVLNSEEKEKISKELYYRNIIKPMQNIYELSEKQKEQASKKKIKKEKEQLRREAKKEKQMEKAQEEHQEVQARKKMRESEMETREAERKAKEAERKTKEAERKAKEAERKKEEARREEKKRIYEDELANEWNKKLLENNNNINKTFRLLSLKYHPDKNTNKSWAGGKQLELNTLKEKSIKKLK